MIITNTRKAMEVDVSADSLGCLVDCLGYTIKKLDNTKKKLSITSTKYKVERPAPGIRYRESIYQPLHTGNILVDSLFPIGRGQRELILGDRQTGKTTIAINAIRTQKYDTLLNYFKKNIYCIYVAIGQKKKPISLNYITFLCQKNV